MSDVSVTPFDCLGMTAAWAIFVPILGFWFWMMADLVSNEPQEYEEKRKWFLITFFGFAIGAAVYYVKRRPERIAQFGK